jgi:hypothetical protein
MPVLNRKDGGAKVLDNAIRKYGYKNFTVVKLDEAHTQAEVNVLEDFYILASKSIENGYNIKRGGSNGKHSEATKRKIARQKKGKPRPKWVMKKMSETKIREGTHRGVKHGRALLNEEKVREIKKMLEKRLLLLEEAKLLGRGKKRKRMLSYNDIGKMYGISLQAVYAIFIGKNWSHVK